MSQLFLFFLFDNKTTLTYFSENVIFDTCTQKEQNWKLKVYDNTHV